MLKLRYLLSLSRRKKQFIAAFFDLLSIVLSFYLSDLISGMSMDQIQNIETCCTQCRSQRVPLPSSQN